MNERAIKLYKEACEFAYHICQQEGREGGTSDHIWMALSTGKFAELIVKECMGICEDQRAVYTKLCKDATDFRDKNVYAEGEITAHRIRLWIQKNFGVKE